VATGHHGLDGDSVTIRSSRPQIQSATSNFVRDIAAAVTPAAGLSSSSLGLFWASCAASTPVDTTMIAPTLANIASMERIWKLTTVAVALTLASF
jgi:hypothetical protein